MVISKFNKNRSCIETLSEPSSPSGTPRLIRTEVVLKLWHLQTVSTFPSLFNKNRSCIETLGGKVTEERSEKFNKNRSCIETGFSLYKTYPFEV